MHYDTYFHDLRITTMQVTSPLIALAVKRMGMIEELVKYINSQERSLQQLEILQQYNEFVTKDKELVDTTRGRIESNLGPS